MLSGPTLHCTACTVVGLLLGSVPTCSTVQPGVPSLLLQQNNNVTRGWLDSNGCCPLLTAMHALPSAGWAFVAIF